MVDASDHLLARFGSCRSPVVQKHAFSFLAHICCISISVTVIVRPVLACLILVLSGVLDSDTWRDVTSARAFFQNCSHFLIEKLVFMIDFILSLLFHSVFSARGFQ